MNRLAQVMCAVVALFCSAHAFAFDVYGEIAKKWNSLGAQNGFLGAPLNSETGTPDGIGRFNHFQGGSIYWTPATGPHEVHGAIRQKWASMGWERSHLGYPISDEEAMPDGKGRFSNFQGGTIFWSAESGAYELHGQIMKKWVMLHGSRGFLGYPVTDERTAPDGKGHYAHFQGGSIYWSPATGAHEVHGFIRDKWASLKWERGALGYPISDEYQDGKYRRSNFRGGSIRWTPQTGAVASISLEGDVVLNPVDE